MWIVFFSSLLYICYSVNNRPIIGIVTMLYSADSNSTAQYIPASYVKWVEQGGARVVPVFLEDNPSDNAKLLSQLNGVLFIGGDVEIDNPLYSGNLRYMLQYTRDAYEQQRNPIVVWGTCMGFEAILNYETDDLPLDHVNASSMVTNVDFTVAAGWSRIFTDKSGQSGYDAMTVFAHQDSSVNKHHLGYFTESFYNSKITDKFTVVGTSKDLDNKKFVAIVESNKGQPPIYAVQFHPEKVPFEWNDPILPHSTEIVRANQYLGEKFVEFAKDSNTQMSDADFETFAIYQYQPIYANSYFMQVYEWTQINGEWVPTEPSTSKRTFCDAC